MIFYKTAPLFFIFLLGYFLKRKGIIDRKDSRILGKLLLNVVFPAIIINSFSGMVLELNLISLPLAALIVVTSLLLFGYFLAYALKLSGKTRSAFIITFPTLEGGAIGYAFMLSAFGQLGLSRIVLFDFVNAIFLFTVVYFLACRFGENSPNLKKSLIKIIQTPILWSIGIGILFSIIGFRNIFLSSFLDTIGGSTLFLAMILLGLEFEPSFKLFKLPALAVLLKTAIGFALGWIVAILFHLGGVERIAVVLGSSLPPSILTLVFSEENNLDTEYNAGLLSLALPFGIIFLTILLGMLN